MSRTGAEIHGGRKVKYRWPSPGVTYRLEPIGGAICRRVNSSNKLKQAGLEGTGDSARDMALRFRAFGVLRECQQHELAMGLPLPDGEIEL